MQIANGQRCYRSNTPLNLPSPRALSIIKIHGCAKPMLIPFANTEVPQLPCSAFATSASVFRVSAVPSADKPHRKARTTPFRLLRCANLFVYTLQKLVTQNFPIPEGCERIFWRHFRQSTTLSRVHLHTLGSLYNRGVPECSTYPRRRR